MSHGSGLSDSDGPQLFLLEAIFVITPHGPIVLCSFPFLLFLSGCVWLFIPPSLGGGWGFPHTPDACSSLTDKP